MTRKVVDTLIIDLDNTIYDWFAIWYATFKPIYHKIQSIIPLDIEIINKSIRAVHQIRRTSEYTFLIEDIDILDQIRSEGDIREIFKDALDESHAERDKRLELYPGVFRALWAAKQRGVRIIAYTESMSFYSAYRLKRLGLDGVIDFLFSPADHDLPKGISVSKFRSLPDQFYDLQVTQIKHTPLGELKPNPGVLLDIIKSIGSKVDRCAYVGDSLFKDVAMARDAGVFDIHAKYGESQRLPEYDILRSISHWTDEDVRREREIVEKGSNFTPSATLQENFSEIFDFCEFVQFPAAVSVQKFDDEIKNAIDVWKKCVDVQQHFNDLGLRIRTFAVSTIGVLIASIGFTFQYGLEISVFGFKFGAGLAIVGAAFFAWFAFFFMDRFWYHILLKGAVDHAIKIESQYSNQISIINLGQTISERSRNVRFLGMTLNSNRRLEFFYGFGFLLIFAVLVAVYVAVPVRSAPPKAAASNALLLASQDIFPDGWGQKGSPG